MKRVLKETEKALLLLLEDDDREEWIPKNQISDPDMYGEGDEDITVSVTEWIANQKDLTGD